MNYVENSRVQTVAVVPAITLFLQEGSDVAEEQGRPSRPEPRSRYTRCAAGAGQTAPRAQGGPSVPTSPEECGRDSAQHPADTPKAQGSEARAGLPDDLRCPEGGGARLRVTRRACGDYSAVFLLHLHGALCFQRGFLWPQETEESFVLGEKPLYSVSKTRGKVPFSLLPFLLSFLLPFSEWRQKYSKPKILDALPKATCA